MTDRTCSIDDCERAHVARGWCNLHYSRWQVHGDPLGTATPRERPICTVVDCGQGANARGLCGKHYQDRRRKGELPALVEAPRICEVAECDKRVYGLGLCVTHWRWNRRYGSPLGNRMLQPVGVATPYGMKWCRGCGAFQPVTKFYVGKRGPESPCKPCRATRYKAYRKANPPRTRSDKNRRRRALERAALSEPYTAIEIADRDGWVCQICGKRIRRSLRFPHKRSLSIDHVIPLASGGDDVRANVQAAHFDCNAGKRTGGTDQLRLIG